VKTKKAYKRPGRLLPHPDLVAAGYFRVVNGQTLVTPKGLLWLAQRYGSQEMAS
jgi:hypothetical protein